MKSGENYDNLMIDVLGKKIDYTLFHSYKIPSPAHFPENLTQKISLNTENLRNDKNPKDEVTVLAVITDQFEHLQIFFDDTKKKLTPIQKTVYDKKNLPEEANNSIKIVRIYKDKRTRKNFFIACTDKKVYRQEISDLKSFRLIFDLKETFGKITDIFDSPATVIPNKNLLFISTNDNCFIEIDLDKTEQHLENTILLGLTKCKSDSKMKFFKHEITYNSSKKPSTMYTVLASLDDSRNPKSIFKFEEGRNVITCKFRNKDNQLKAAILNHIKDNKLKPYLDHNQLAISLGNNTLCILHYESKCQVAEYTSYYGNFISLEYTLDGRILGAGTESDHVFIIDCETKDHLFTLEGHKNYITQIRFFEVLMADSDEQQGSQVNQVSNSTIPSSKHESSNSLRRRASSFRIPIQEVNTDEMKNLVIKDIQNNTNFMNVDNIRRSRSVLPSNADNNEESKSMTTYDIITVAMDGYLAVWRIDLCYNELFVNQNNYCEYNPVTSTFNLIKTNMDIVDLIPKELNKISYSSFVKISNNPVVNLLFNENFMLFVTKKTSHGGIIFLKIYNGVAKVEEVVESNFLTHGNASEDYDDMNTMITERNKTESSSRGQSTKELKEVKTSNGTTAVCATKEKSTNSLPLTGKVSSNTGGLPNPSKNSGSNNQLSVPERKSSTNHISTDTPKKIPLSTVSANDKRSPIPSYSDNKRKLSEKESSKKTSQKDNMPGVNPNTNTNHTSAKK